MQISSRLTSRSTRPLITSFPIDHGIGNVVVILKALRILRTFVNSSSTTACSVIERQILRRLIPKTKYHCGLPLPFFAPWTPPVRVGSAGAPRVFNPTAKLGIIESKRRKRTAGARKNRSRTPSVPTTSTLRGGCERTRVLHVCGE